MAEDSYIVGRPSISRAGTVLWGCTVLRYSSLSGAGRWGSDWNELVLYLVIKSQFWTYIIIVVAAATVIIMIVVVVVVITTIIVVIISVVVVIVTTTTIIIISIIIIIIIIIIKLSMYFRKIKIYSQ